MNYANPKVDAILPNVPAIGSLAFNRHTFDFADTSYAPTDLNLADTVQIGVVPAGHVLVPHLCRLAVPQLETGSPVSDYTIGTEANPDALKGSAPSETAAALFGEDWLVPVEAIGHPTEDTPIYITIITANPAGTAVSGSVVFEPVYRAWRDDIDTVA